MNLRSISVLLKSIFLQSRYQRMLKKEINKETALLYGESDISNDCLKNITIFKKMSLKNLSSCEFIIVSGVLPDFFIKKDGQKIIFIHPAPLCCPTAAQNTNQQRNSNQQPIPTHRYWPDRKYNWINHTIHSSVLLKNTTVYFSTETRQKKGLRKIPCPSKNTRSAFVYPA